MIKTTLFATSEFSHSLVSTVPCMLLSPGDDIRRKVDFPATWSEARIHLKYTVVGGNNTMGAQIFFGFCSGNRTRNNTNNQHCIGWQSSADLAAPGSDTGIFGGWGHVENSFTDPANSQYGWNCIHNAFCVITGSVYKSNGFLFDYVPKYETAWSSSYPFAAANNTYMWRPGAFTVGRRPFGNNWTLIYQKWPGVTEVVGNMPQAVFRSRNQKLVFDVSNTESPYDYYYRDIGASVNAQGTQGGTFAPMNEPVYGDLDSVNIYWACSLGTAKLAVRDINVVITT